MSDAPTRDQKPSRKGFILPLLCVAQFMVILDVSIVNIALPSIQSDLSVDPADLQWVVTAYGLALGGFLLLGGRSADLLGRRRVFMAGVTLFGVSSLVCGLSSSMGMLIAARAVQGLGAAFTAPAALSILTSVFSEGAERNRALGIWGAIGGSGGAAGVLLGGVVTDSLGWEWIFFLNVPIGLALVLLTPRVLPESVGERRERHFDVLGAVSVTSGLMLGVYAVHRSIDHGWTTSVTLGCLVASLVLLAGFVYIESRARWPLMPLRIFRNRALSTANAVGLLVFGTIFSLFFILSLYMQQVLGYSPLRAGLAYLPLTLMTIIAATLASQLVTRVGSRAVLAVGMTMVVAALLLFARAPTDGHYLTDLLPGYVLVAFGLGLSVVPVQVTAFSGVREEESGLAAGLINTSQEIGGALMVATLATVAVSRTRSFLRSRSEDPQAVLDGLVAGFHSAFIVGACIAALAVLLTLLLLPRHVRTPKIEPEPLVRPVTPDPLPEPGVST